MKGLGTKDTQLIRILVSRSEVSIPIFVLFISIILYYEEKELVNLR